jgi:hypothetical protein
MTNEDGREYLPPAGDLLFALSRANLKWAHVLGEWIDNAFDADAQNISFEFGSQPEKFLRIIDDGKGCKDPREMVRLGAHAQHKSTRLGRYGIGGKDAALWVGEMQSMIRIRTFKDRIRRDFRVRWKDYAATNWHVNSPVESPAEPPEKGTTIIIEPRAKDAPAGIYWANLLEELGYLYAPAIAEGRQIKLKRIRAHEWDIVKRWEPPKFQGEYIDKVINVEGRQARVYVGVVEEGCKNDRSGFTYHHEWRVIEKASSNGCGPYNPANICGFVKLIDQTWPLTKNKDGVSGDIAELLYQAVEEVSRPALERGEKLAKKLVSSHFEKIVDDQLNELIDKPDSKGKRKRKRRADSKPPGNPTGMGSKHEQSENEQPGDSFKSKKGSGFSITYSTLGKELVGQIKGQFIILNKDNPVIAQCYRESNAAAIVVAACFVVAANHCILDENGQPHLFKEAEFNGLAAKYLGKELIYAGQRVVAPLKEKETGELEFRGAI